MDHPAPWTAYGQHYSRLAQPNGPNMTQNTQMNDLSIAPPLSRQDMTSYGSSPLLLPGLNAPPQPDPTFVNSNHLISTSPYHHESILTSFPPTGKGHHLPPLNMSPHTHPQNMFKTMSKETEINELRGGFSRRISGPQSANSPMTPGVFNSQSPHSWRPPDLMPTPSSPFGVLPHEAVMHRNTDTPTSGIPAKSHPQQQQQQQPQQHPQIPLKSQRTEGARYVDDHGYRNMISPHGHMITAQPELSSLGYQSRSGIIPQSYHLNHPQFDVHVTSPQHQLPLQQQCTKSVATGNEIFGHGVPTTSAVTSTNSSRHNSSAPVANVGTLTQPAMMQPQQQQPQQQRHVTQDSSPPAPAQSRDLAPFSTFNTTPTIPTHSQSFLANQIPGMEFTENNLSNAQNGADYSTLSTVPSTAPPPPIYPPLVATNNRTGTDNSGNVTFTETPTQQCMVLGNNMADKELSLNEIPQTGTPRYRDNSVTMSNISNMAIGNNISEMNLVGETNMLEKESKRRKRRRRKTEEEQMSTITPMTPVQANKLSHKMAPPLSVPLHHPPVTSPVEISGDLMQPQMTTSNEVSTNEGASTSGSSTLSPADVQLSPPQLPSTPASNPGSVPEKCVRSTMSTSIEDDLGFLAELPLACNIRLQQKKSGYFSGNHQIASSTSNSTRGCGGSFLDSFLKFVKGDSTPSLTSLISKKGTRGRGRARGGISKHCGNVELNPSTGLFVPREPDMKESENVVSESHKLLNPVVKSEIVPMSTTSTSASEVMVPNPEAPKFSSDEDFSPMGLESLVHSAIQGLSDGDDEPPPPPASTNVVEEKPIKLKLVGIQSGNVHTAKRGRGRRKTMIHRRHHDDVIKSTSDIKPETPVRRLSMRKCKEVVLQKRQEKLDKKLHKTDDDDAVEQAVSSSESEKGSVDCDSDSDPAWTPLDKSLLQVSKLHNPGSDEEKRRKLPKKPTSKRPPGAPPVKRGRPRLIRPDPPDDVAKLNSPPLKSKPIEDDLSMLPDRECPGKPGDFVVAVSDLSRENPTIWRIDGKSLLQKFEAFNQDGKVYYRNKSTYAGWTWNSRSQYQSIPVRLVQSTKFSVVVECVKDLQSSDVTEGDGESEEVVPQKESFEVYLQTLISQVLDPNFISEIVKERDEYFLSHVHVVDTMVERCKAEVGAKLSWNQQFKDLVEMCPSVDIGGNLNDVDKCQVCGNKDVVKTVIFTRLLYDYLTLATMPSPNQSANAVTESKLCSKCADGVFLYSQVHHQKFNFYNKCATKVTEMRDGDPSKESHIILQYCLLDGPWINTLLNEVQLIWQRCLRTKR